MRRGIVNPLNGEMALRVSLEVGNVLAAYCEAEWPAKVIAVSSVEESFGALLYLERCKHASRRAVFGGVAGADEFGAVFLGH